MNKMIRTLMTLAALAAGSVALQAQPALKLVVVDMAKVFDSHYKAEEALAKFRDAEQKAKEQVEEMNKQLKAIYDEGKELEEQAKNALLTPEARTKAEDDFRKKADEFRRKQEEIQGFKANTERSLQQRFKNLRELLLGEISQTVTDLAKKQGATLVLDKSGPTLFGVPTIVYADPAYDITAQVIAEVNKDRPPAPAPAAATPAATTPAAPAPATPAETKK